MKRYRWMAVILAAALNLTACQAKERADEESASENSAGLTESQEAETDTVSGAVTASAADMFSDRDYEIGYEESECAKITLKGETAESDTDAVKISGSTATITDEGSYIVTGILSDGMIIVEAEDTDKVTLILDGVDITSLSSAAIYVKSADKVFVITAKDSENTLSNGGTYENIDENNIDAVIFSKSDLTLNGEGSLTVTTTGGHGILSKDDLKVTSGSYTVDVSGQALSGKNSVRISGGSFDLNAGKDGIHSENTEDTDKGFIYVSGGSFYMKAADEGMSATNRIWLSGGEFNIEAVGDGLHADGNVTADGASMLIKTDDDGIHADGNVAISAGKVEITESYEGIEGLTIDISGGEIDVMASDDGLNAAGGNDESGFGTMEDAENQLPEDMGSQMPEDMAGQRPGNMGGQRPNGGMGGRDSFDADEDASITISGGILQVNAGGDGIDSNGSLIVNGGETYVSGPENNGNGTLDYGTEATISGGIFVAAGTSGMAQNFTEAVNQGVMLVTIGSHEAGTELMLKNESGSELLSWTPDKSYECVIISCPEITEGASYTVTAGDDETLVTMESLVYGAMAQMGGRPPEGGN